MTITEEKKALRKLMFEKRRGVDGPVKKEYDTWICNELEKMIRDKACNTVHAYIPFGTEIDISPLIKKMLDLKITVVCPKTLPKRKLENRILHSLDDIEIGIMGTMHPAQADVFEGKIDLVIVPGLAYDRKNYRLGYGGGYYDNFLITQPGAFKVGIFYPVQQVDVVPVEAHDISLDSILVNEF